MTKSIYQGLKNQLVARLAKALKSEADPEEAGKDQEEEVQEIEMDSEEKNETQGSNEDVFDLAENEIDMADVTIIDEYDSKAEETEKQVSQTVPEKKEVRRMDEREKRQWTKRYTLPDNPAIVVHPSRTAKSGKFDCTSMSLSLLLDYRQEDTKEHSFEVSLFAEMFNEMLMRDAGFNIYKALSVLPDPVSKNKEKGEKKPEENEKESESEKSKEIPKKSSRARSKSRDKKRWET